MRSDTPAPARAGRRGRRRGLIRLVTACGALAAGAGAGWAQTAGDEAPAETANAPPAPPLGGTPGGRGLTDQTPADLGAPQGAPDAFGVPGATGLGAGGAAGAAQGQQQTYTILPRIDLSEAYNTNALAGTYGRENGHDRSDFVTQFTPSVAIIADTPRLQGSLFYAPTFQLYARNSSQNSIAQNLNGSGTATVLADAIYINGSAFAGVEPRFGGFAANTFGNGFGTGAQNLGKSGQTQVYNFSVEPYAVHNFADVGTLKVGYIYSQSYTSNQGQQLQEVIGPDGLPQLVPVNNSRSITSREVGQFSTGDILGYLRGTTLVSLSQYGGGGVQTGAYEDFYTQQVGYAVTRTVTVFAEGGYEDIRYNTAPVTKISDPTWSFGAQITPDADSLIVIGYGYKFGYASEFGNASYAITDRTRLTAVYSFGLGTALQGVQALLNNSTLDANGNPVDQTTGAPTFISSGLLGTTNADNLYRSRTFTGTLSTTLDRDTFSFSVSATQQTYIGSAAQTPLVQTGSQDNYNGVVGWVHDINPDLTLSANVAYGQSRTAGQSRQAQNIGGSVNLSQAFSDDLTGYLRYTFSEQISDVPGQGYTQQVIQIGLSKTF